MYKKKGAMIFNTGDEDDVVVVATDHVVDERGPLVSPEVGHHVQEDVLHHPVLEVGTAAAIQVDQVDGEEGVE